MSKSLVIACLLLTGCAATIVSNDGKTVVVEWDQTITRKSEADELAVKSCQQIGKTGAAQVNQVSTDPASAKWLSTTKITYECK